MTGKTGQLNVSEFAVAQPAVRLAASSETLSKMRQESILAGGPS